MQILGNLGIDINLLVAQIVNFGVLLWILNRFVYKPIVRRIEEDEAELQKAGKLEKERVVFKQERNEEVSKTKEKARLIIKEAEEVAEKIKEKAIKETAEEKKAVIKQIRSRLEELENEQKKVDTKK